MTNVQTRSAETCITGQKLQNGSAESCTPRLKLQTHGAETCTAILNVQTRGAKTCTARLNPPDRSATFCTGSLKPQTKSADFCTACLKEKGESADFGSFWEDAMRKNTKYRSNRTAILGQKPVTPMEHRCNQGFVVFSLLSKEKKESLLYALLSIERAKQTLSTVKALRRGVTQKLYYTLCDTSFLSGFVVQQTSCIQHLTSYIK